MTRAGPSPRPRSAPQRRRSRVPIRGAAPAPLRSAAPPARGGAASLGAARPAACGPRGTARSRSPGAALGAERQRRNETRGDGGQLAVEEVARPRAVPGFSSQAPRGGARPRASSVAPARGPLNGCGAGGGRPRLRRLRRDRVGRIGSGRARQPRRGRRRAGRGAGPVRVKRPRGESGRAGRSAAGAGSAAGDREASSGTRRREEIRASFCAAPGRGANRAEGAPEPGAALRGAGRAGRGAAPMEPRERRALVLLCCAVFCLLGWVRGLLWPGVFAPDAATRVPK